LLVLEQAALGLDYEHKGQHCRGDRDCYDLSTRADWSDLEPFQQGFTQEGEESHKSNLRPVRHDSMKRGHAQEKDQAGDGLTHQEKLRVAPSLVPAAQQLG